MHYLFKYIHQNIKTAVIK